MEKGDIPAMMEPSEKFYIKSVNRALSLVEAVSKEGAAGVTLSELVRPDLPMSSAYRIIQNLVAWQYVREREDGRYVLGTELGRLGRLAQHSTDIVSVARKHLKALAESTGQTVYLTVADWGGHNVYYVDKIKAPGTIQLSASVGTRHYIHTTANGKVLASDLSDSRVREILAQAGMPKLTDKTITDPDVYLEELRKVRRQAYALDDEENEKNVVCVAAPVFDHTGRIVASVSVSGINGVTLTADRKKEIRQVCKAAGLISGDLSYKAPQKGEQTE